MLESVNRVYFKKSDYDSIDEMFHALFTQQLSLTRNSYMCVVYQLPDDASVYVLEFASLNPIFNQDRLIPCWITSYEASVIATKRLQHYQRDLKDIVNSSLKLDIVNDEDDEDDNDLSEYLDDKPSGGNNSDA